MWILILALVGADGFVTQVEAVPTPFTSFDACRDAGVLARADIPALSPPGPWQAHAWHRIDWVCVETGAPKSARQACIDRRAARERLRAEFRHNARGETRR